MRQVILATAVQAARAHVAPVVPALMAVDVVPAGAAVMVLATRTKRTTRRGQYSRRVILHARVVLMDLCMEIVENLVKKISEQ